MHETLHLQRADGQLSMPLEDLDVVLLESPRGTISHAALHKLAERAIALMVTDERHTPCAVLLPYSQNPRTSLLLDAQMRVSEPFKKRVWQQIVVRKIRNCASCLRQLERPGAEKLDSIASTVKSGDTTGREAYAAREYFRFLEDTFKRREKTPVTAALDYGYAVLRALMARSLAAKGLQCALGTGHRSRTNPFNLADDLLEVFRPFVDLMVFSQPPVGDLTPAYRDYLVSTSRLECSIKGNNYSISTAATEVAESYARAVIKRDHRQLRLPELTELHTRSYD